MAWGDELRRSLETSEGLDDREIATKVGLPAVLAEWLRETTRAAMAKETVPTVSEFVQVYTVGPSGIGWAEAEAAANRQNMCRVRGASQTGDFLHGRSGCGPWVREPLPVVKDSDSVGAAQASPRPHGHGI